MTTQGCNGDDQDEDSDNEVIIKPRSKEENFADEEQNMQRFVDYIRKQGLVIMDASATSSSERNKFNKGNSSNVGASKQPTRWTQDKSGEDESVITIYQGTVQRVGDQTHMIQNNAKRISSSSEDETMNTSNELDEEQATIQVDNLTVQTNARFNNASDKVIQFITENSGWIEGGGTRQQHMADQKGSDGDDPRFSHAE